MDEPVLFAALTAGLILVTAVLYEPVQRSLLTEPLLAVVLGAAVGPRGLGWLDPQRWENPLQIVEVTTEHVLAIALMATALRLPHRYPRTNARSQLVIVFGAMLVMSLASAAVFWAVLDLPLLVCLTLGAIVAPTDPVLATTVVTGRVAEKNVPAPIRNLLTGESGANDCIALPFVLLPVLLLQFPDRAFGTWFVDVVLYENVLAVCLGLLAGWLARSALHWGFEHHRMSSKAFLSYSVSLSMFVLSVLSLLHMNGIFGVFVAGLTFNYGIGDREEATSERVQESVERLFVVPGFLLFGVLLPWEGFARLGWRAWAIAGLILALRRLPSVLLLRPLVPELRTLGDAAFVGWFGPMGVATLYYAARVHTALPMDLFWEIPCLVVLTSVVVHGVTCAPLVSRYGSRMRP